MQRSSLWSGICGNAVLGCALDITRVLSAGGAASCEVCACSAFSLGRDSAIGDFMTAMVHWLQSETGMLHRLLFNAVCPLLQCFREAKKHGLDGVRLSEHP